MEATRRLAPTVLATVRRWGLLRRGDRVVAAVSGGPDSMALLDILAEVRDDLGLWLCVAHLDHGLRPGAASDAAFVAARAAELGLAARVGTRDVGAARRQMGGSVEMAARRVRYAFLGEVAAEVGASRVALGHTADDQVETIVLKFLRGEGLGALCGMPASRPLSAACAAVLVRPLLEVTRAEVLEHLAGRGLAFRMDETNVDPAFERNAVRHELLPLLEARGGGLRAELLGVASAARQLSAIVAREAERLAVAREGGVRLDVAALGRLPRLVRRAAVGRAHKLAGGTGALGRRALDAVEELFRGGSGRRTTLAGGVEAWRSYGAVWLRGRGPQRRRREPPDRGTAPRRRLAVPGRVEVKEAGTWVAAERLPARPRRLDQGGRWEEVVDLDRAGEPLVVRTREAGDRFVPLGLGASKKLKDFFIDERLPRGDRERTLVVEGPRGIVWVVGLRLDERAKVRADTRSLARLRAGPIAEGPPETGA